jgi:hypothetical protein
MKITDAFGEHERLEELFQAPTARMKIGPWLDMVYQRCLETMEPSSALPSIIEPLCEVLSAQSGDRSSSSKAVLIKVVNLLGLATTIAIKPVSRPSLGFTHKERAVDFVNRESTVMVLRAQINSFRQVFNTVSSNREARLGLAAIGAQLGEAFLDDLSLHELLASATVQEARELAICLAYAQ